jgi:hypothetical protein
VKLLNRIGFWLAGYWSWWRDRWNARQQHKAYRDCLIYGSSFTDHDRRGRIRHIPYRDFMRADSEPGKHG